MANAFDVTYSWTGPEVLMASEPGIYTLAATNPLNGCISNVSVEEKKNVAVPANLTASISDLLSNNFSELTLSASSITDDVAFFWCGEDGFSLYGASALTGEPGEYIVVAVNLINGCSESKQVLVIRNEALP